MHIPRAAVVRFPYGNPLGMPNDADLQRQMMTDALRLLEILDRPGLIARLPYRWRGH